MEGSGENIVEGEHSVGNNTTESTTEGETGAVQRRRFSTRSQASSRKTAEVALLTGFRAMEFDKVEGNISIHLVLTGHLLGLLEKRTFRVC